MAWVGELFDYFFKPGKKPADIGGTCAPTDPPNTSNAAESQTAAPTLEENAQKESAPEQQKNTLSGRLKFEEKFKDVEFASQTIWDYFNSKGKIKKIGESFDYSHKLAGIPTRAKTAKGSYFLKKAAFTANIGDSEYSVELDNTFDDLTVKIECGTKDLSIIEKLLADSKKEIVSITRHFEDRTPLIALYKVLTTKAKSMKILPQSPSDKAPRMAFDETLGIVPVEAKILAEFDGTEYAFNFISSLRDCITIDCPKDKIDFVKEILESLTVTTAKEGEKVVKCLDFSVPVEEYHWDMVGGLGEVKHELQQYIEWPLENPDLLKQLDTAMPKGILFIGPPGNGKTTIAKIIANETKSSFYTVSPKDINSMWVGGTERNWGCLFGQARHDVEKGKTAIIFIDEIDGFFTNRDEMDKYSRISFGQFCQEIDGISDLRNVILLAATNKYEILDPALVRPGRFTKKIYLGNPDAQGRKEILGIYTKKKPLADDIDMGCLVEQTDGFSGAQIKELCDIATFNAIQWYSTMNAVPIKDIKGDMIKDIKIGKFCFENALTVLNAKYSSEKDEQEDDTD